MAGSFSDYLENELLDHIFKTGAFTVPTNLYLALSTSDPLDSSTGITEPSSTLGYARLIHNTWDVAAAGATENTGAITFAAATGNWGSITHVAIFDSLTSTGSNNMLVHADLDTAKSVNSGDTAEFAAGAMDITLV